MNEKNKDPDLKKMEESNRIIGSLIGGSVLGASLWGYPGCIIGGLFGLFMATQVNESKRRKAN